MFFLFSVGLLLLIRSIKAPVCSKQNNWSRAGQDVKWWSYHHVGSGGGGGGGGGDRAEAGGHILMLVAGSQMRIFL